jgi:AcrR family transcriptional regulator
MTRSAAETRQAILDAADQIVHTQGVTHLTLEAVAKAAGVSKGGLLYHFPGKEALIKGMILYQVESGTRRIDEIAAGTNDTGPGGWARALLHFIFEKPVQSVEGDGSGLLAAVAENPELLEPFREMNNRWQRRLENDGIDPVTNMIVRLVIDGLLFQVLFGLDLPPEPLRLQVRDALLAMTTGPLPAGILSVDMKAPLAKESAS